MTPKVQAALADPRECSRRPRRGSLPLRGKFGMSVISEPLSEVPFNQLLSCSIPLLTASRRDRARLERRRV
jgi:hypothetical protein